MEQFIDWLTANGLDSFEAVALTVMAFLFWRHDRRCLERGYKVDHTLQDVADALERGNVRFDDHEQRLRVAEHRRLEQHEGSQIPHTRRRWKKNQRPEAAADASDDPDGHADTPFRRGRHVIDAGC